MNPWKGAAPGPAKLQLSFVSRLLCKDHSSDGTVPSLPLCSVSRCLHSLLSPREGELWVRPGLGTPGSSWGEVPSALQLQNPGRVFERLPANSTCSPTSVCVLVQGSALSVPNEHWKMAHLHCSVLQQTKENLIISSWLAGSTFCWAARQDGEGPCCLKIPVLYQHETALQWHLCSLGCLSRGRRQVSGVAGS